ncbi:hypothetical protein [Levilactobacillus fujinensis]|uniref:hypothetical protein n=1 Tax=Levilactobacillus fujinensis TaxID=2486024 RepID=UPI0036D26EB9
MTNKQFVNGKKKRYQIYVTELAEQRCHKNRKTCHYPCKSFLAHFKANSWAPDAVRRH